ncbi:SH3 domain-containing protein [Clostridium hydrogeniformans]|uniref:SH3 domain-containing protein n=1 Tax=Clostridium hydrogeniformans TaxID=349933 RepID=UPI000ADAE22A|nr:SH3 domain-containing protein [Clostridium hydrogeniformans]
MNKTKLLPIIIASSITVSSIVIIGDTAYGAEGVASKSYASVTYNKSNNIMGNSEATKAQMKKYFNALNKTDYQLQVSPEDFIDIAYEEAEQEGVRGDILVAQAFHETGYFTYGYGKGIVKADYNNFGGIGAVNGGTTAAIFKDVREGLRAQVQHLKAYASTEPLKNAKVDPRFHLVARGSAKTLEQLGGKWAYPGFDRNKYPSFEEALKAGDTYGQMIYSIIKRSLGTSNNNGGNTSNPEGNDNGVKPEKPVTPEENKGPKGKVINVTSNLRIRQGAGTNTSVVGYLMNGETFEIKGKSGDWYHINANGKVGYIHKDYVEESKENKPSKPDEKPITPEENKGLKGKVINVTSNLRIRQGAGTNTSVVGYLINGETFEIKGRSGDWYHINANGKVGYIHKDYVEESKENKPNKPEEKPVTPEENKGLKGKVINVTSNLRIRQGAGTNTSVVGYLINGETFEIKGKSGDWYHINAKGKVGYIHKDYVKEIKESKEIETKPEVKPEEPKTPDANTLPKGKVINITSNLRIRQGAGLNTSVVGYLNNGQTFNIKGKNGDWYHIEVSGKVGYIHKDYVQEIKESNPSKPEDNNKEKTLMGKVVNVTSNLRLRKNPSTDSSSTVVAYLMPQDTFEIIRVTGDWYNVKYKGNLGYIHKDYVKVI